MRVAVVSESFLPTVNGVTTSVLRVLDHLAEQGHEAIVICPEAGAPDEYAGFRIHQVPSIAYRQFPVGLPSPQVQRILARFGPDVLHAASPFFLGAQAIAAANRVGVPSVAVYQTDVAGFARRNGLGMTAAIAWKYVRWVHEGADLTLVPSAASEYDLRQAGVRRLARWGRGVDLERYHPNNRRLPAAVGLRERLSPDGEIVIGYVGRIAPEKQVERLRVLKGLPGVSVAIVGDGPAREAVERQLHGVPTTWLGRLGGAELGAAYAAFDAFVHTGSEETFGQTVQEAHASGLPVIAPRAGGPIDLVDHGVDGLLFPPSDDRALRAAVAMLATDAPLRVRMGEAGRRRVLGRGWDVLCSELIGHYERVILDACSEAGRPGVQPTGGQRAYS
ncbi:glycosyl transferase [Leifsonia sp. Leaf336]|uniref:glycosyltransferase family 4 protein n=1 Tax=Leifsonia sp. Leaf336 TaxID=1736341 RepID=UPI0006F6B24E|nr:glycosyltransferase family 1 protein [Leifsonia sp. Leaf336]KQR52128.1 glycosyl transferase [Leifsonia sp. Leaf336]